MSLWLTVFHLFLESAKPTKVWKKFYTFGGFALFRKRWKPFARGSFWTLISADFAKIHLKRNAISTFLSPTAGKVKMELCFKWIFAKSAEMRVQNEWGSNCFPPIPEKCKTSKGVKLFPYLGRFCKNHKYVENHSLEAHPGLSFRRTLRKPF